MAARVHGSPTPRKTLTELLPVTLTMEASAVGSSVAAILDAKRSGMEVPRATNVMPVIMPSMSSTQPKISARSAMRAVTRPMKKREPTKQTQPPRYWLEGQRAKSSFHGSATMWKTQSRTVAYFWSSQLPLHSTELANCSRQHAWPSARPPRLTYLSIERSTPPSRSFTSRRLTVRMAASSSPSRSASNSAPSASSKITRKLEATLPALFGRMSISIVCSVTPSSKRRSPSPDVKSYSGMASKRSVRHLTLASPLQPSPRTTTSSIWNFSCCGATSMASLGHLNTPPLSIGDMRTSVDRMGPSVTSVRTWLLCSSMTSAAVSCTK
mmetsp:Transcript_28735/g.72731  ORF Transcript_28735/g.72731 Transcript_28735/m.72731 type:complete len:325 (+) Transcript_28735:696-1670(+)